MVVSEKILRINTLDGDEGQCHLLLINVFSEVSGQGLKSQISLPISGDICSGDIIKLDSGLRLEITISTIK